MRLLIIAILLIFKTFSGFSNEIYSVISDDSVKIKIDYEIYFWSDTLDSDLIYFNQIESQDESKIFKFEEFIWKDHVELKIVFASADIAVFKLSPGGDKEIIIVIDNLSLRKEYGNIEGLILVIHKRKLKDDSFLYYKLRKLKVGKIRYAIIFNNSPKFKSLNKLEKFISK
ncbi:hypothetical protein [Crocinitomix catalasitica]|uniref:hypothetical protein n=1 Tax=Crocinitomix catalasitica TaxID=184607 RepID=UPI00048A142D|nr:hypothetical protein [Crocinitomix catalasitica]